MGKGLKRSASQYQVPGGDEPDFSDPPRNWGRVASMAGVWAVVLLGAAWMAPGFASGGDSEETDARDQAPITPRQAAARYLEAGLDGESDRVSAALCDGAAPQILEADLVALRDHHDELLGSYPEIEVSTEEPVSSESGLEVAATVSFIGSSIYREEFAVTVLATGDSYCVSEVELIESEDEVPAVEVDPQEQAAKYLSAVFVVRDIQAASGYLCTESEGPETQELADALASWEDFFGSATAVQSFEGDPVASEAGTIVPMSVELSAIRSTESFTFEVTIQGDCVAALSGGEALLDSASD